MAATEEIWMPREIHNHDRGSTYGNDGECECWRGSLGNVRCYQWCQASVCWPPHLPISMLVEAEAWEMASIYSLDRALTYSSHTSERRPRLPRYSAIRR